MVGLLSMPLKSWSMYGMTMYKIARRLPLLPFSSAVHFVSYKSYPFDAT